MILPFVEIGPRWYVVTNWSEGMEPGEMLHLRPLTKQESVWLEPELENAQHEIFARLFPTDAAVRDGAEPPGEDL